MLDFLLFMLLVIIGVFSAILMFIERELLKVAIGLAVVFITASGFLLLLNQDIVALLQLLVLVGGLSTYLIVAVASDRKATFPHTNMRILAIIFVILGVILIYAVAASSYQYGSGVIDLGQAISYAVSQDYALMYLMVLLLFSTAIGGVLLIKRMTKIVV